MEWQISLSAVEKWENWGTSPIPRLVLVDALCRWKVPTCQTQVQGLLLVVHDPRPTAQEHKLAFCSKKNRVLPPLIENEGVSLCTLYSSFGSCTLFSVPSSLTEKPELKWLNHKNAPFPNPISPLPFLGFRFMGI